MPDELEFRLHSTDDGGDGGGSMESKVTRPLARDSSAPAPAVRRVIVKVRNNGYVPDGFDVRTRIDDLLFTAEASPSAVRAASHDPAVESISATRRLHPDETGTEPTAD